ncbi:MULTISPECIES: nickel/cobalt efflux protein RcnA [Klebsiella]|uniref:Nickel/cobalt efflux system n=1 Tax=Klebsiella quasipneumoniae subsp. quasipneumoniae TaxID=1667327 RepID=A0AAN1Y754_9ENTR|nr:nickel/cobalt efflux protein RcnA [Klebsiella quasipneumoniae]MCH9422411.1 nickel/cobalt efflux protein RcnA [Klebsiella quasipneumoniae]MDX7606187.1 nickel/cobalt efflux protein RcnA [Klebsiella quasipneumoniae]OVX10473.1 nickel/cobalt efflux protein RcnA [Klebsiella quasipneumoniae subsp. similipneumoniae]OVY37067.1 nickel/cobalt efflux protein RcnA [Klebsiella quasipneumoniae subsp. quasipneumoniae]BDO04338.1 nickel/cobalt efflux system [Klebsiella quasipneumoniae subsp. quasipneumoniae]
MNDFTSLLQQGNAWLFIPSAILLGALHGLEPGHSKTMMAAFIVAVRGTLKQAVLLGLAATVSHTAVVWLIAMAGLWFGRGWNAQTSEPWFQLISGVVIVLIACWMLWRTWRESRPHAHPHHHQHGHDHDHHHDHHHHEHHDHHHSHSPGAPLVAEEWQDAHQRAHAQEINRRFDGRQVTTGQIVMFGLTGGLIPCPASITVLLICLQLKKFSLGATLVLGFSVGLALTLVASGAIAALSMKHATRRWPWLNDISRKAPWISGLLIIVVGIYMMLHGLSGL